MRLALLTEYIPRAQKFLRAHIAIGEKETRANVLVTFALGTCRTSSARFWLIEMVAHGSGHPAARGRYGTRVFNGLLVAVRANAVVESATQAIGPCFFGALSFA